MPSGPPTPQRWWSIFDPRSRHGAIYLVMLSLRCFSALFGYGYIHPDEWMQSGEPYFGFKLPGIEVRLPWEWFPDHALRSFSALRSQYRALDVVFPLITRLGSPSGRTLFLVQRVNMLLSTVLVDIFVGSVLPPQTARYVHYLSGISTATTTFLIRPFSNSHESNLLALCILHTLTLYRDRTWYRSGSIAGWHWGVLFAVLLVDGFFTRFTFAIFAAPVSAFFLCRFVQIAAEGYRRSALTSLTIGAGALAVLLGLSVQSETSFFTTFANATGIELASLGSTGCVVPPINALLYNVRTENVAQHGLHPRWLHVVVNLPMMVGVANCIVVAMHGWHFLRSTFASIQGTRSQELAEQQEVEQVIEATDATAKSEASAVASTSTSAESTSLSIEEPIAYIDIEPVATRLCLATIIFSLLILSLSPHQEPRFLLALAFPSTLLMAYSLQSAHFALRPRLTRTLLILHVVQHTVQLVLFSFLHQSALLPALFHIDHSISHTAEPVYEHHLLHRTFTVPLHLVSRKGRGPWPHIHSFDSDSLESVMAKASIDCDVSWIYAPTWTVAQLQQEAEEARVVLVKERIFGGHVDMDHLGESWAEVGRVGWWEAFAIQKLAVRCRGKAETVEDVAQTMSHEEL